MEKGDRPVDFARLKVNTCLKYIVNEDESPHVLSYLGTSVIMCVCGRIKDCGVRICVRVCVYVYFCMCMCIWLGVYACVSLYVCLCIVICVCIIICVCVLLYVCVYYYMCVCIIICVCVLLSEFMSDEGWGWNDLTSHNLIT